MNRFAMSVPDPAARVCSDLTSPPIERMHLTDTDHRPWPAPRRHPFMHMDWDDLAFLHWPVPASALAPHLPAGLELDTFDGTAWLGVVPFRMSNVHPRGVPSLPWISRFAELNVRTYVTTPASPAPEDARPGVFFLSLDAANPVAVRMARKWFHLPYFDARMEIVEDREEIHYRSVRTHRGAPPARFEARYRATGPEIGPDAIGAMDDLTRWLTERYCLYGADRRGRIYRGEVHHRRWPLRPGEVEIVADNLTECWGIERPATPPLVLVSRHIEVAGWSLDGPL